ncbi:MAG: GDP-mannose 4,6-dehydratase, partial [Spirochaetaceae bacterium]
KPGQRVVAVDSRYFRPAEVEQLLGDPTKIREKLGWKPEVSFQQLVHMMVDADLEGQRRERYLQQGGYEVKNYFE